MTAFKGSDSAAARNPQPFTLVVMAAGIGSRYGGLKQVDPVGPSGEMIIDYSVYDAVRAGFRKVVFVIRREIERDFRDAISRNVERHVDTAYSYQELDTLPPGFTCPPERRKPWGTAHAVLCARSQVPGPFAAINADDYYGPSSFAAVAGHLARAAGGSGGADGAAGAGVPEYSMAGYLLRNTLSEHGHVSRGVCEVAPDGFLRRIVERTAITLSDDGIGYEDSSGHRTPLPDDATVSMNIWGFRASFFDHLDAAFRTFLSKGSVTPGAECYLPAVINDLIERGQARVRVLSTDERWFGITYREDMPAARAAIRERMERGVYPDRLWG